MEFCSRRNVHELFQKVRDFKKIISEKSMEKALNDEDDTFASLNVEEDVTESLKMILK